MNLNCKCLNLGDGSSAPGQRWVKCENDAGAINVIIVVVPLLQGLEFFIANQCLEVVRCFCVTKISYSEIISIVAHPRFLRP